MSIKCHPGSNKYRMGDGTSRDISLHRNIQLNWILVVQHCIQCSRERVEPVMRNSAKEKGHGSYMNFQVKVALSFSEEGDPTSHKNWICYKTIV